MILEAPFFTDCLDISEPIEPPAPVINTTLSLIFSLIKLCFASTSYLPSKSVISTSFNSETEIFPCANSAKPGRILTLSE